jgi:hypothetical protein
MKNVVASCYCRYYDHHWPGSSFPARDTLDPDISNEIIRNVRRVTNPLR